MKLRIREAMDSSIPQWLKPQMSRLSKRVWAGRYNRGTKPSDFSRKVDTANTVFHPLPIPRTAQEFNTIRKDPNQVTVVHVQNDDGRDFVWLAGFNDDMEFSPTGRYQDDKPISKHAAKNIIPRIIDYGYLEIAGPELADLRKSRTYDPDEDRRRHAQYQQTSHEYTPRYDYEWETDPETGESRKVYKQGPAMKTWETPSGYDKSGYKITGLDKYRKMLASMGLRNYDRTMDRIYDSYTGLASSAKLCRGSRQKFQAYRNLTGNMARYLEDIERYYADYMGALEAEKEYPSGRNYVSESRKSDVEECLKRLREYAKKADELVSHLMADDWTDSDYDDFSWRL